MNVDAPRIRYATAVLGDMFPDATVRTTAGSDADGTRRFALAPSARRPRLLVPTSPRGAAATALRAYGGRLTRQAQLTIVAATHLLAATGPAPLRGRMSVSLDPADRSAGIDEHLSDVLGRQVSVAAHLTPDRANRKPIVQALAAGERYPVAFAKMGVSTLTSRLVEREADSLNVLAGHSLRHLTVPSVVHFGDFAGKCVLTLKPLPTWQPGRSPTLLDVAAATQEVAATVEAREIALQDSPYWLAIRSQAGSLPPTARAARLNRCVDRLTNVMGRRETTFTASHGDWSPWNMWLTEQGLLVWDWERFDTQTPAGFDLLHFRLNDLFVRYPQELANAGHRLISEAADVLGVASDAPRDSLETVLIYLLHIGLRYESDGQAAAGAAAGHLESWLLPALEAALTDSMPASRS